MTQKYKINIKGFDQRVYGTCAKCHRQFPHEDLEGVEDGIWFVRVCEGCKKELDPKGNLESPHVVSIVNTGEGPEDEGHNAMPSGPRQLKLF